MSKPGKVLKAMCKRLGVRLTVKRNGKRVYKRVAVLKRQCANKKKRKVKRRRNFGVTFEGYSADPPTKTQVEQRNLRYLMEKNLGRGQQLEAMKTITEHHMGILKNSRYKLNIFFTKYWNTHFLTDETIRQAVLLYAEPMLSMPLEISQWNDQLNGILRNKFNLKVKAIKDSAEQISKYYGPIENWNTFRVTKMGALFKDKKIAVYHNGHSYYGKFTFVNFNKDISKWDTRNVTNMMMMFYGAEKFDKPIGNWNVSKVTDMSMMFYDAERFNQPIGNWNVSKVTNMTMMFQGAKRFNQPIGNWNVSKVTNMTMMFYRARKFNQPIGNWNVSKVTDMSKMFFAAERFNQVVSTWKLNKNAKIDEMFSGTMRMRIFIDKAKKYLDKVRKHYQTLDDNPRWKYQKELMKIIKDAIETKPSELNSFNSNYVIENRIEQIFFSEMGPQVLYLIDRGYKEKDLIYNLVTEFGRREIQSWYLREKQTAENKFFLEELPGVFGKRRRRKHKPVKRKRKKVKRKK